MTTEHMPFGETRELKALRELLPTVEVKNKVIFVNPNLENPFRLEIGQPTNIGRFISAQNLKEDPGDKLYFETERTHKRSLLLGRIMISEKPADNLPRQLYRDIDVKGVGYIVGGGIDEVHIHPKLQGNLGILNKVEAKLNTNTSEILCKAGVKVARTVAIIELEEIVSSGKKISIKEAKKKKIIFQLAEPVLEVRAFPGTQERIVNLHNMALSPEKRAAYIADAKALIIQELKPDTKSFSDEDYAVWFAKKLGENLGRMHKRGYMHKNISEHNVTLDCTIVDFDTARFVETPSDLANDFKMGEQVLHILIYSLGLSEAESETALTVFKRSYDQHKKGF